MISVDLTDEAYAVLCGLVQPSDDVNVDGIVADQEVWDEIRTRFPLQDFQASVANGAVEYVEEAGL
jgi:hypothetical protein